MDQIPAEIQKLIVSFTDHNTRLNIRATNTYWFKYFDYRDFKLYRTRTSDLPAIIECLSRYQAPISLSFEKQSEPISFEVLAEHITKLTTLTGLDLPQLKSSPVKIHDLGKEFIVLSTLTTLKSLNNHCNRFATRGYDIIKIAENFSNLTSLIVKPVQIIYGHHTPSMNDVAPIIQQNPNLIEIEMCVSNPIVDQHFVDKFVNNKKLTKLELSTDRIEYRTCNLFNALSTLKNLKVRSMGYYINPTVEYATWNQLTNLEKLHFRSQAPMENVGNLKNLTSLHVQNGSMFEEGWNKLLPSLSALHKLKHLSLSLQEGKAKYEFLYGLTSLESLSVERDGYQPEQSILQQIRSTHLTRIEIESISPLRYDGYCPSLVNVREFSLKCKDSVDSASLETLLSSMPHLTTFTYKPTTANIEGDCGTLEKLSSLRSLTYEYADAQRDTLKMNLQQLGNIEDLDVKALVDPNDLQYCPHLTSVHCHFDIKTDTDYKYLSSLPLRVLAIRNAVTDNKLFAAVNELTSLEYLLLTAVEDEQMLMLNQLVNVTKLVLHQSPKFTGATLGHMTALQEFMSTKYDTNPNVTPLVELKLPNITSIQLLP